MAGCKQLCKLCDHIVSDENFTVIDEVLKNALSVLLLKLTFDNETHNVMCKKCSLNLLATLSFKSTCIYTDNTCIPYIDLEVPNAVDSKEMYAKEKGTSQESRMLNNKEICRLCSQPMSKSVKDVAFNSIQIHVPEIKFAITTNPTICINCHDALCIHIRNCFNMKEKYIPLTNSSIKMEEIIIKCEDDDETLYDIQEEENEESNVELDTEESKSPSQGQMFKCDRCDYKSVRKHHVKSHQLIHKHFSEVKMYKCDKCSFTTKHKNSIRVHQLRHKDPLKVKMYTCGECDYKTIHKYHLKNHQMIHRDPTEVHMYKCDKCEFITKHRNSLRLHQTKHKDPSEIEMFKCDKCTFETKRRNNLLAHQLIHKDPSEVQMYSCDNCDYKSRRKSDLKTHQLKHKDPCEVQKYECECGYKSIHKYHLKSHQLSVHKHIEKGALKRHQLKHKDPSECDFQSFFRK